MFLCNPSRRTARALVAAALSTTAFSFAARAQTNATWNTPTGGNWSDPTKWSTNPNVPNNNPPTTYNALITTAGTYTINQDLPSVQLATLNISQPTVTLDLLGNSFTTTAPTSASNIAGIVNSNGAQIDFGPLNSTGTLNITGGSLISGRTDFINKLNATNADITLYRGAYVTSNLPTRITRTGGSLTLGGTLNNTGSTINVDSGLFQNLILATCDVTGGTLTGSTGTLTLTSNPDWSNINNFTNVTLGGKIDNYAASSYIYGDLTLQNATYSGGSSIAFQNPNRTLGGTATFSRISDVYGQNLTIESGITFANTNTNSRIGGYQTNCYATVRNDGFATMTVTGTFSNRGSITTTAGGFNLQTGTLTNYGSISLSNTNVEIPFDGALINNGSFTATNTAFRFLGMRTPAALTNYPLGGAGNSTTFYAPFISNYLASGIDATGTTLSLSAATGNITCNGATLLGGRFNGDSVKFFDIISSSSPRGFVPTFLSQTTFAARAELRNGALLRTQNSPVFSAATLNLTSSSTALTAVQINGGETLTGSATITFNGTQNNGTVEPFAGAATIGPSILVQTGTAGGRVGDPDLADSLTNQGTLWSKTANKTLFITGKTFTNSGTLKASNGGSISIFSLSNFSNLTAGTLTGGTYVVETGANIDFSGRTFSTNAADISLSGPNSTFAAANSLSSNQGSFSIDNARNFTTTSNLSNAGTLRVGKDSTLTVNGTLTNTGKIKGKGTIRATAITSSGTFAPGDSPGLLTIDASLTTDSTSILEIELAGDSAPGTDYDALNVLSSATFNGTLKILLVDGYIPTEFSSFTFLTSPNLTVNFTTLDLPPLPGGMQWNTNALSTGTLSTTPEPSPFVLLLPMAAPLLYRRRRSSVCTHH